MIKLYSDADLWNANMQKRRILGWFWGVSGFYFLALLGCIVWYTQLPYKDPLGKWFIVIASVLTAIYLAFVFPYMGICFKRCKAYCKMLKYIAVGLKDHATLPFADIEDWTTRDGVDVNVATFHIKNVKRDELMIRQIYVDGEKDFPPFEAGQYIELVTHGNILIEYEITDKKEPELAATVSSSTK